MNDATLTVKKEIIEGQKCVVLCIDDDLGKHVAILPKDSAVKVAQAILTKAWECGFIILKDDEQAERHHE